VKLTEACERSIASIRSGGLALSGRTIAAPIRIGNSTSPPSPKVKASGGEPMKRSSGGLQHAGAIGVADSQKVAMEMHRALGLAGGAGGEADQADIVAGRVGGGEILIAGRRISVSRLS
jgi:hypothetical protein